MKLVSINVSEPVEVEFDGKKVATGIFKKPVSGRVSVGESNLDGDGQADLTVHGGKNKAVYAYSLDHYAYWQEALGRPSLPHGQFGENLTMAGLDETQSCIGDHLQIGSALFAVTQPRVPCFKLGIRFNDMNVPKLFTQFAYTGFYLKVLNTGWIEAGQEVRVVQKGTGRVYVRELFLAYTNPKAKDAKAVLKRAVAVPELADEWRVKILKRL